MEKFKKVLFPSLWLSDLVKGQIPSKKTDLLPVRPIEPLSLKQTIFIDYEEGYRQVGISQNDTMELVLTIKFNKNENKKG